MPSQYTYENVCIVPGGRAGLTRVAAVIGDVYCVCFVSSFLVFYVSLHGLLVIPSPRLYRLRSSPQCVQETRSCSYCVSVDGTIITPSLITNFGYTIDWSPT